MMEKTEKMKQTSDTEKAQLLENESNEKSYLKTATGVIAIFSTVVLFSASATCVQLLERRIPDLELNAFRSGIPLLFYTIGILIMRRWPVIKRKEIAAILVYSLGVCCSRLAQFVAVSFLPAAAAFCVCCTSGIISGIFIFALCGDETVTLKKLMFACLCVCGVILIIQPWMQLEGHKRNVTTVKENSTYESLDTFSQTLCTKNSSQQTKEGKEIISQGNITLCDQNESQSLKRPQNNRQGTPGHKSNYAILVSEIVSYSAAVSQGIFLGLYVLVLKKNPYINKHPLDTLFWVSILGTTVSLILMLLIETPVLPSNWFEFIMVMIIVLHVLPSGHWLCMDQGL